MQASSKKIRPKSTIVYSQPKNTHQGKDANTQVHVAVSWLKERPGTTLSLQDLSIHANLPMIMEEATAEKLRQHPKIQYHPATSLYSYKAEVVVDSKDAIIAEMQRHAKRGTGVSVKVLKESWKGSIDAILELEEQGKIVIIRSGKENQPKFIFWNNMNQELAEEQKIDEEFKKMWNEQKVPEDADVLRALDNEGLAPTISQMVASKPQQKKKSRKGQKTRMTKITNTHIQGVDLSMDYQPTPPS